MTQNERLRELLAEARETLRDFAENWDCDSDAHKYGTTCRVCESREAQQRIDAALAEPVGTAPERSPLAPGEGTWSVFAMKVVQERDEARAEIERLKSDSSWGALRRLDDEWRTESSAAFRRGAEAMREAAADLFHGNKPGLAAIPTWSTFIRSLPIPEDKP